jgi:hypothetical protein
VRRGACGHERVTEVLAYDGVWGGVHVVNNTHAAISVVQEVLPAMHKDAAKQS